MNKYLKVVLGVAVLLVIANIIYLYSQYQATLNVAFSPEKLKESALFIKHEEEVSGRVQKTATQYIPEGSFSLGPTEKAAAVFDNYYRNMRDANTFRIKVYDKKLTVLWSNLSEVIGKNFTDDTDLKDVIESGEVEAEFKGGKDEQLTERNFANFSEVIVPIKDKNGVVVGAIESYQSIEEMVAQTRSEFNSVAIKSLGVSLVILVLVAIGGKFLIR